MGGRDNIIDKLNEGYILLVGFNAARLVPRPRLLPNQTMGFDVPYGHVLEMIENHEIGKLTKFRNDHKSGWREMGLEPPMKGQAYYLMMQ